MGNLYHHYILSTLRKDEPATSDGAAKKSDSFDIKANYSVPSGGLFDYVTMPHYFFELIAWLGIAFVSQDINVYLVFASMFTYLLTRAKATKVWYLKNVDNYPKSRNVLLPFVLWFTFTWYHTISSHLILCHVMSHVTCHIISLVWFRLFTSISWHLTISKLVMFILLHRVV